MVTRPDAPSGRGRKLVASPVAVRAEALGVPVLKPEHPRDPAFQDALRALEPACCPVVAYGALLPQSALEIPEHGWVNLHFSVLPAWRGAAPVQHAIWAGDEVTGATTFRIVRELDAGPTFGLMTQTVRPDDTAGDLLERLAEGGAGLLVQTLDGIEDGSLEAREQPAEGVSLAPKITVEDARVDWTEPAVAVDRRIRACTPAPGAWSTWAGERIKLGPVTPVGRERLAAGTARGHQERRLRRHRDRAGPARDGSSRSASARWTPPTGPVACSSPTGPCWARDPTRPPRGRRRHLRRPARDLVRHVVGRRADLAGAAEGQGRQGTRLRPATASRTSRPSTRRPASSTTTCS